MVMNTLWVFVCLMLRNVFDWMAGQPSLQSYTGKGLEWIDTDCSFLLIIPAAVWSNLCSAPALLLLC